MIQRGTRATGHASCSVRRGFAPPSRYPPKGQSRPVFKTKPNARNVCAPRNPRRRSSSPSARAQRESRARPPLRKHRRFRESLRDYRSYRRSSYPAADDALGARGWATPRSFVQHEAWPRQRPQLMRSYVETCVSARGLLRRRLAASGIQNRNSPLPQRNSNSKPVGRKTPSFVQFPPKKEPS